jgi:hypothetical protein
MYGSALENFGTELDKLAESIKSIREGHFLRALVREELKQDANWVIKLRKLPQTPETYYLLELMASHDFQESLKNYLDLEQLRKKLEAWEGDLGAFEEIIEQRRAYYQPLLPAIDREFRRLDSQMRLRLEQRDRIERRLKNMLVVPRPDYLATSKERIVSEQIVLLEQRLSGRGTAVPDRIEARIKRLRGMLHWNIYTDYDRRLTETYGHLRDLNHEVDRLKRQYTAFVRTRQAATQSYRGICLKPWPLMSSPRVASGLPSSRSRCASPWRTAMTVPPESRARRERVNESYPTFHICGSNDTGRVSFGQRQGYHRQVASYADRDQGREDRRWA